MDPGRSPPFLLSAKEVAEKLSVDLDAGLEESEVEQRLAKYGKNALETSGGPSWIWILVPQITNAMILVLIGCMVVSYGIRAWIEASVIAVVVLLNIAIGFIQEYSAEQTMDSLRNLASPTAHVVRSGTDDVVPAHNLVPGDIVMLKMGDTIPADVRLYDVMNFETDEALLTGESLPVAKVENATFDDEEAPVGDRITMAFSSTSVVKGRARGIVVYTGMNTEIGAIAKSLNRNTRREVKRKEDGTASLRSYLAVRSLYVFDIIGKYLGISTGTPLQRKLAKFSLLLFLIACIFAFICFAANGFQPLDEVIIYAVATAVSIIPASLPAVLTICMAVGTKRMVKRNVIVRRLDSLEALGSITDICSDKTGTLTQGKMVVRKAWIPELGTYSVSESNEPYNPTIGDVTFIESTPTEIKDRERKEEGRIDSSEPATMNESLEAFLNVAGMANISNVRKEKQESGTAVWKATGEPTEIALQVFASRFDMGRSTLAQGNNPRWSQIAEYPFDSDIKRMCCVYADSKTQKKIAFVKGAVERITELCEDSGIQEPRPMDQPFKSEIFSQVEALAGRGLRVVALAMRDISSLSGTDSLDTIPREKVEDKLTFLGLVGIYDPPRPTSAAAVKECHEAGISVHMLTGDHPATGRAIAKEVGILPQQMGRLPKAMVKAMVMTAQEFDKLSDEEVDKLEALPLVIARCAPHTKVRMIEALHRRKRFCAMTGDGVNDSPSLKRADVGIGMGKAGSDVAKDASDLVLTDDNFASIVNAIEEGRKMFDNVKRFILHLLASNLALAFILLIGLVFKDIRNLSVFPLSPIQVIWIIMATCSFPAMGLGMQEAVPEIMTRPPHDLKKGVFTWEVIIDMVAYGVAGASLALASFSLVVFAQGDGVHYSNMCNDSYNESCVTIFRGRSTVFAFTTFFMLLLALQMIDFRRSIFLLHPESPHRFTQFFREIWKNQFLFWSVIAGWLPTFAIIYIPVINTTVFSLQGITWEWGVVFGFTIVFLLFAELWKYGKRVYFRHYGEKVRNPELDLEVGGRAFTAFSSFSRSYTNGEERKILR